MVLRNHIAWRFLTDRSLIYEMCGETHLGDWKNLIDQAKTKMGPEDLEPSEELESFIELVRPSLDVYYVTQTVLDNLDLLKVSRTGNHFDWTVFKNLKNQKVTLILPDNKLLRVFITAPGLQMFWLTFSKFKNGGEKIEGNMKWVMLYLDTDTGKLCEHFDHKDAVAIEEFIYKLMCFFYLTENDELQIQSGKKYGSKKSPDNMLNDFKFPVTVVNSRWNITTIRTEGFTVSGHFRLQPCGIGFIDRKIIFIEPFEKQGYVRKAKSETL